MTKSVNTLTNKSNQKQKIKAKEEIIITKEKGKTIKEENKSKGSPIILPTEKRHYYEYLSSSNRGPHRQASLLKMLVKNVCTFVGSDSVVYASCMSLKS